MSLAASLLGFLSWMLVREYGRRRSAELALQREAELRRVVSELWAYVIDLPAEQIKSGTDAALSIAKDSLGVDRLSILELVNGEDLVVTHTTSADDEFACGRVLRGREFPFCISRLAQNRQVVWSASEPVAGLPLNERERISTSDTTAGAFLPLGAQGSVFGVLLFMSNTERQWSESTLEMFGMVARIFVSVMIRERAEEAARAGEALKLAIVNSLSGDVVVAAADGRILSTNSVVEAGLCEGEDGQDPEFSAGANCLVVYKRLSEAGVGMASEVLAGIEAVLDGRMASVECEWTSDSSEGRRWFMTSVAPLRISTGGFVITHTDITDRKRVEEDCLELSGRLIGLQEKERSRLARELHDDFNQRLAVLAIDLERVAQMISTSPTAARSRLHEMWARATEIGADLHALSHRLHSSTLESLGLVLGVSSLCREFSEQNEMEVDFAHEGVPRRVDPEISLCLFRVAQEALRNVQRHSGASRAEVRLEGSEECISLSITDEGSGFQMHAASARCGLGIRSMQERLRLLGGQFELWSRPGQGTVDQGFLIAGRTFIRFPDARHC